MASSVLQPLLEIHLSSMLLWCPGQDNYTFFLNEKLTPNLSNLPLLDHFPAIFEIFDSHCVPPPYNENLVYLTQLRRESDTSCPGR